MLFLHFPIPNYVLMYLHQLPYRIFPLGDSAITIDFGNCIDENINREVIALFRDFSRDPLPGMTEAVPAYSSLSIFFDLIQVRKNWAHHQSAMDWITEQAELRLTQTRVDHQQPENIIRVPVCYEKELGPDLPRLAQKKNITVEEVIRLHTSKNYKLYMLGFLPGFPYLGEVDEKIVMARKPQPMTVMAGSVGIAGRQTGIYPLTSPGGWQIIGRTTLKLFDAGREPSTLLQTGDTVQFYSISRNEFESH